MEKQTIEAILKHFGTQKRLAEVLRVEAAAVSQWFSAVRPVPYARAVQIAYLMRRKVQVEALLSTRWSKIHHGYLELVKKGAL